MLYYYCGAENEPGGTQHALTILQLCLVSHSLCSKEIWMAQRNGCDMSPPWLKASNFHHGPNIRQTLTHSPFHYRHQLLLTLPEKTLTKLVPFRFIFHPITFSSHYRPMEQRAGALASTMRINTFTHIKTFRKNTPSKTHIQTDITSIKGYKVVVVLPSSTAHSPLNRQAITPYLTNESQIAFAPASTALLCLPHSLFGQELPVLLLLLRRGCFIPHLDHLVNLESLLELRGEVRLQAIQQFSRHSRLAITIPPRVTQKLGVTSRGEVKTGGGKAKNSPPRVPFRPQKNNRASHSVQ